MKLNKEKISKKNNQQIPFAKYSKRNLYTTLTKERREQLLSKLPKDGRGRPLTFQNIIDNLLEYWGDLGCVVAQPYGLEVGAGTSNPNTFFRALGPEPYNVINVEPSRRPDDARYGENPNRFQHFYQMQIILKPAPSNNIDLYIKSLEQIGIFTSSHDLRLVEDNWKTELLGAWGLGWEIWLDGMEITQYTYFQQFAGHDLPVPSVEIAFGLERISMYIQNVGTYEELMWNEQFTYADVLRDHEFWQSVHNLESSNPEIMSKLYELYELGAREQIEKYENYFAAYDYLLKMSHTFNLQSAKGLVSLSDRTARFKEMGKLSYKIGELYLQERVLKGYPLKKIGLKLNQGVKIGRDEIISYSLKKETKREDTLVLEFGFEEIPADYLKHFVSVEPQQKLAKYLSSIGCNTSEINLYITSRRITIILTGVPSEIKNQKKIKGPLYSVCYDEKTGQAKETLSKILEKFSVSLGDVEIVEENGYKFVYINKTEVISIEELSNLITDVLFEIFPVTKFMHWDENKDNFFIRPLRWIYSKYNEKILKLEKFGVVGDDLTFSTRFNGNKKVRINDARDYLEILNLYLQVRIDHHERLNLIKEQSSFGSDDYEFSQNIEEYFTINNFLTESPIVKFVELDEKYQKLPFKIVTKVLEDKQKYLIRFNKRTKRTEYGIVADFTKEGIESVIKGNYKVVCARLDDAVFYMNQDIKNGLKNREDLKDYVFNPKLIYPYSSVDGEDSELSNNKYVKNFNSFYARAVRVEKIAEFIYKKFFIEKKDFDHVNFSKALELFLTDRGTNLVNEYPELETEILKEYLLLQSKKNNQKVAEILYSSRFPIGSEGELPSSLESFIISLADKLDRLFSLSFTNDLPKGSNDPFEARKFTYTLIYLLTASEYNSNAAGYTGNILLDPILDFVSEQYGVFSEREKSNLIKPLKQFLFSRLYNHLREKNEKYNDRVILGCVHSFNSDIKNKVELVYSLQNLENNSSLKFKNIIQASKRLKNILKSTLKEGEVEKLFLYKNDLFKRIHKDLIENEDEKRVYMFVNKNINRALNVDDFAELSTLLEEFFEKTMVNVTDAKLRQNRIILLQTVLALVIFIFNVMEI